MTKDVPEFKLLRRNHFAGSQAFEHALQAAATHPDRSAESVCDRVQEVLSYCEPRDDIRFVGKYAVAYLGHLVATGLIPMPDIFER